MVSRKLFGIFAIIIGVLVVLAGGVLLLVKALVTPEMIRKNVLPRVEKAVHRRMDFDDAKIGLFSGIALSGLKVYEKDGKGSFVSLKEARLHYQILPLLSHRVVVDEIVLDTPDINIVRNTDGSFNFSDLTHKEKPEAPAREAKTPLNFAVSRISVSDGRVIYDDRMGISGTPFVYGAKNIDIKIKNLTPDHPFPLKLKATVPGVDLGFSGSVERITDGPLLDGDVTVDAGDLAKVVAGLPPGISARFLVLSPSGGITAKIHVSGPVKAPSAMLRDGNVQLDRVRFAAGGQSPVLTGKIDISNGALVSRDFTVDLGKNRLNLLIKTTPIDRKPLVVELDANSDSLDLDSLSSSKKTKGQASPPKAGGGEPGPSPNPPPLSVSGAVNVKTARFKGLPISGLSLRYMFAGNTLQVRDLRGSTAGGFFLGNVLIKTGTSAVPFSVGLSLRGVQVERIVPAFAPGAAGKISGILSAKAELSGAGATSAAIKRDLAGTGSFDMRNGRLAGGGFLNELARFLGRQELRDIHFSSYAGTFRIKGGQIYLDSTLDGSGIRTKPKGRIGFDKTLDMNMDTSIAPRTTGSWAVIPLKVTGTTGSPHFSLSSKSLNRLESEIGGTTRKLEKGAGTELKKGGQNIENKIRGIFGK
ncbi:MAG TPA: AsmA family protein [Geobacteraceae bacterium]|nr:AsmA family protein [Geobacteraceae bacterium]